jgi:hypothetical protein
MIIDPDDSNLNISSLELYKKEEIFNLVEKSKLCYKYNSSPKIVECLKPENLFEKRKFSKIEKNVTNDLLNFEVKRFKHLEINDYNYRLLKIEKKSQDKLKNTEEMDIST